MRPPAAQPPDPAAATAPLISIVIPLWNGETFLRDTLDAMAANAGSDHGIEVVMCDDASTDATPDIAAGYCDRDPRFRLEQNATNLGMDGNFAQVASLARGEYIWFFGQDDIPVPGAVSQVAAVLRNDPTVDAVHVNFSQHSHEMGRVIKPRALDIDHDRTFSDYRKYLRLTGPDGTPGFLPSLVIRRSIWERTAEVRRQFAGTTFAHLAGFLEALPGMRVHVIARPLVQGRIPDDRWQASDLKRLEVEVGHQLVIHHFWHSRQLFTEWMAVAERIEHVRSETRLLQELKAARVQVPAVTRQRLRVIYGRWSWFWIRLWLWLPAYIRRAPGLRRVFNWRLSIIRRLNRRRRRRDLADGQSSATNFAKAG